MPKDEDQKYQQRIRDFLAGLEEGPGILSPADEAQKLKLPVGVSGPLKELEYAKSGGPFANLSQRDKNWLKTAGMTGLLGASALAPPLAPVAVPLGLGLGASAVASEARGMASEEMKASYAGGMALGALEGGALIVDWKKMAGKAGPKVIQSISENGPLLTILARQAKTTVTKIRARLAGKNASRNLAKLISDEARLGRASLESRGVIREAIDQTKGSLGRAAAKHPRTAGLVGSAGRGLAWTGGSLAAVRALGSLGEKRTSNEHFEALLEAEGDQLLAGTGAPKNPVETEWEKYSRQFSEEKGHQKGRDLRMEGMLRMQADQEAMKKLHREVLSAMVTMASRKMAMARYLGSRAEQGAAGAEGIDKALTNPEFTPSMFLAPKSARMQAMFAHHGMKMPEEVVRKGQDAPAR